MNPLVSFILFVKKGNVLYRIIAFAICCIFISTAIPDLKFNMTIKDPQSFTLQQIIDADKQTLPLYLKISDVEPSGMYVEETRKKKYSGTSLSAIVYPVYSVLDTSNTQPCYIVVKDSKVNEDELETYFTQPQEIAGKFDRTFIDQGTRDLLKENGYEVAEKCIMISKGVSVWSVSTCVMVLVGAGLVALIIAFSFVPALLLFKIFKVTVNDFV